MKHLYTALFAIIFLVCSAVVAPAQRLVKGIVYDATNTGLPGVTVLLKDTQNGTLTDIDGRFQLLIPHDTVIFSFASVGYVPLEKKMIATKDTFLLAPIILKEDCMIDLFYSRHVEVSLASGLRYTPFGGKIRAFYPYLISARNSKASLRAEFSYQTGSNNYQRNATLALDELILNCENELSLSADYQGVYLAGRNFSFNRYSVGILYEGKLLRKILPLYLAVGKLAYSEGLESGSRTGFELGTRYYVVPRLDMVATVKIAYWQSYWQYQVGVEARYRRFTAGVYFNSLGKYTEVNTSVGFKIQKRYHAKRK